VSSDNGDLALVKATPQHYSEVARFAAIEGKTWNYPIAGGKPLVRNTDLMDGYNIAAN
jgi:outer membrane protein assembly factor BamB